MTLLAATSWPDASIAIAGILLVTVVVSILIWQIFATGRRAIGSESGKNYRQLAEDLAAAQRETTAELQKANAELAQLRLQTQELQQGLAELDRMIKSVE